MKANIFFYFIIAIALQSPILKSQAQWFTDFESAQNLAMFNNRLLLVDFTASWCGPCREMDNKVWSNPEVQEIMSVYVPIKLNFDTEKEYTRKYRVTSIPRILILDPSGKVVKEYIGYRDLSFWLKELKENAIDLSYFNKRFQNYNTNPNFMNSIKLAYDYQLFSLVIPESSRYDYLNTAHEYLIEAKKAIKHEPKENQADYEDLVALFEIQEKIIRKQYKAALRKLDKFDFDALSAMNQDHFNFLLYECYQLTEDARANSIKELLSANAQNKLKLFQIIESE